MQYVLTICDKITIVNTLNAASPKLRHLHIGSKKVWWRRSFHSTFISLRSIMHSIHAICLYMNSTHVLDVYRCVYDNTMSYQFSLCRVCICIGLAGTPTHCNTSTGIITTTRHGAVKIGAAEYSSRFLKPHSSTFNTREVNDT